MIDIGCYIEAAIEWLTEEGAVFFDALNVGVESFIDSFQLALYAIPLSTLEQSNIPPST